MVIGKKKERIILGLGDVVCFLVSVWLTLITRYGGELEPNLLEGHIKAFAPAIVLFIFVFYIYNLYGKQTIVFRRKIVSAIINSQIVNGLLAVVIFYFAPLFGLTPKTNLFIYFLFSTLLIILWRLFISPLVYRSKPEMILLIGDSDEADSIAEELASNPFHGYVVIRRKSNLGGDEFVALIRNERIQNILIHFRRDEEKNLAASLGADNYFKLKFVDVDAFYEELFDRVPLSKVNDWWFIENIIVESSKGYDILKRIMDIVLSFVVGVITLPIYPFVAAAIFAQDGGSVFIKQERVGQFGRVFNIYKFRSMTGDDKGGAVLSSTLKVTKVGAFLRATRIDELPQLWSVMKGDLSLVGPRPELPALVAKYKNEIPFYGVRHLIKPGLSGWAQFHQISASTDPHHGAAIEATREKLSFDLFYLKHRSFWLDIKIAFRTMQIILSCVGV